MINFKKKFDFEERRNEAQRIRNKYPDRIPIIIQYHKNHNLPSIDKHKFLVPQDISLGQFLYIIRKRMKLHQDQAVFLFINNQLIANSQIISNIYKEHCDKDKFLYIYLSGENAFGFKI